MEQVDPKVKDNIGGIPPERIEEMRDYAIKLHRKFPHMKPDRVKRKVAEYFKVKLV